MNDTIAIRKATFWGKIGITPEERSRKQPLVIDVELETDIQKCASSDNVEDTINYAQVCSLVKELVEEKEYNTVEAIIEKIAEGILRVFSPSKVRLCIKKPHALSRAEYPEVFIERRLDDGLEIFGRDEHIGEMH